MNPRGELPALKNPRAWPGALAWIDSYERGDDLAEPLRLLAAEHARSHCQLRAFCPFRSWVERQ